MTVEEATEYFKKCNDRIRSTAIDENRTSKFMKETIDANNMAIKSFEAWEKVKEEILTIQKYDGNSFINISYLLENIINKHLQEVENGT